MTAIEVTRNSGTPLTDRVDAACQRIAPLWPLKHFVAVNPYFGLRQQPFWQADETLKRIVGVGLSMPRAYYQEQIASGRITHTDLVAALREFGNPWDVREFEQVLARKAQAPATPRLLVADVLSSLDRQDWSSFVVERISQYCAAYFDEGQALWSMPWRDQSLYQAWLAYTRIDKSPWMMGVRGMEEATAALPATAEDAIAWALRQLAVPQAAVADYLHAALLSIGGWAGWTRYRRFQAELKKGHDNTIRDLLAIRLAWDALLYQLRTSETLKTRWQQTLAVMIQGASQTNTTPSIDAVLQTAFEIGYQRSLMTSLTTPHAPAKRRGRAAVQAVFCIDVRSEVYRRALETVTPNVQTLGFAGFFGVLMEYLPLGAITAKGHLPILFNPSYRICEHLPGADEQETGEQIVQRHTRIRAANGWKTFKTSAVSCFTFVEAAGLLYAPKLFGDSMGWSRSVSHPDSKGLDTEMHKRLGPKLSSGRAAPGCAPEGLTGIPEADRPAAAEFALRNMAMIRDFARLVVLIGHGSTTTNNPQATALDCGACAGQTGEASARIAVALLNDPPTRQGLIAKGIVIPADTHFLAGLHDTTTDVVRLFNTDDVPASHAQDLIQWRQWLDAAGQITRMERAALLGTGDWSPPAVNVDMQRRTRDWAQVRPEWALAGNAAFIAAPRTRTARCDLAGRSFLHEYNWHDDVSFSTLQLIMTAPMVVANWINMQYYGSVVDNRRFGSGNKVLHNVVGGSIGVLEGNGGDLRSGLALQSLHDGTRWIHEPMRLNVFIEAPQAAIDDVIARHDMVRDLIENAWIHLFRIDEDGGIDHRGADKQWQRASADY